MTGLIFLATVALAIGVCVWIASALGGLASSPQIRAPLGFGIFLVLLSLPFIDEVIGKYQFEALCKANWIESVDVSKARGKRVKLESGQSKPIDGFIMPITEYPLVFKDDINGDTLFLYNTYRAHGGWLMRYTWLSMGSDHTMLFDGSCYDPQKLKAVLTINNINLIN